MYRSCIFVSPAESIHDAVHKIDKATALGAEPGIAVVAERDQVVIGVVSDGDVRRAICRGIDFSVPVAQIMSQEPICVPAGLDQKTMLRTVLGKMHARNIVIDKLIIVDDKRKAVGIINLHDLYRGEDIVPKQVAVYGMGFVGLTLAVTFAEHSSLKVEGLDLNGNIVESLRSGVPHFYEKGLASLLRSLNDKCTIVFNTPDKARGAADVHIVSVGTPLKENGEANMEYLELCANQIGPVLRNGDLVICRSTVPVGTTRNVFVPMLEKNSGLTAGRDFFVAFAPERTVEGDALRELRSLPQIVGGLTNRCREMAASLFQRITATVVYVDSLEAAEIIKLINNTYRDLVFSFANEVAYLCDQYNVDAFDVIAAANEGYPRNPIPRPSPGVGGICLTKDPHLYTMHQTNSPFASITLGKASRTINQKGADYVLWGLKKFQASFQIESRPLKALVVGVAFKGVPDTSDLRFSPSVTLIKSLQAEGHEVYAYDAVVPEAELRAQGVRPVSNIAEGLGECEAVFFMNNHPRNTEFDLYSGAALMRKPCLFFDGWRMFSKEEIESIPGVTYFTMGYMTPRHDV